MKMKKIAPLAFLFCNLVLTLKASVAYTFSDSPGGVELVYNGSLNTADLSWQGALSATGIGVNTSGTGAIPYQIENFEPYPGEPFQGLSERYSVNDISYSWNLTTTPTMITASSGYGDTFGFYFYTFLDTTWLNLPYNYISGAPISGGMVFAGDTLASMGLSGGDSFEVFLPDGETITASVPEAPATNILLLIGLIGVIGARRFLFKDRVA